MDDTVGYFSRSNEVLDEFVSILQEKHAQRDKQLEVDKAKTLEDFENFQNLIKQSPKMRAVFAALQEKFASDPDYAAKVDPNFVAGVMLLDLPSEQK